MPTVKLCVRHYEDWEGNPRVAVSLWGTGWTDSTNGDQVEVELRPAGTDYTDEPIFEVIFDGERLGTVRGFHPTWERRVRDVRFVNTRGTSKKRWWRVARGNDIPTHRTSADYETRKAAVADLVGWHLGKVLDADDSVA